MMIRLIKKLLLFYVVFMFLFIANKKTKKVHIKCACKHATCYYYSFIYLYIVIEIILWLIVTSHIVNIFPSIHCNELCKHFYAISLFKKHALELNLQTMQYIYNWQLTNKLIN